MKKLIEFDQECDACDGTGIYVGIAERDGAGIECYKCKGTGKYHFVHKYAPFVEKKKHKKVKRVFEWDAGIMIGGDNLSKFGGMSYEDWFDGKPFPEKSEMRKFVCPARWYNGSNKSINEKDWCIIRCGQSFHNCKKIKQKAKCWELFDKGV